MFISILDNDYGLFIVKFYRFLLGRYLVKVRVL